MKLKNTMKTSFTFFTSIVLAIVSVEHVEAGGPAFRGKHEVIEGTIQSIDPQEREITVAQNGSTDTKVFQIKDYTATLIDKKHVVFWNFKVGMIVKITICNASAETPGWAKSQFKDGPLIVSVVAK
jgi:hypothetical protein